MFKLPTLPSVSSLTAAAASHIQAATQLPGVAKLPIPTPISAEATEIHNKCYLFAQNKPSTQQADYDKLVHYFKYASTAYALVVLTPNGKKLVTLLTDILTDTHGYIARDDGRKEIVVAFRGSVSPANFITDFVANLVDFDVSGVTTPEGTKVHLGFQTAWKTVLSKTLSTVDAELKAHPGYSIVTTGHSLGGALASLSGVTLKSLHPNVDVRMYTYGQPRTGNVAYAEWANKLFGSNIYRVVNSFDGVPTMVPELFGYRHHGVEYWILPIHSASTTRICTGQNGEEDPWGSKSIPSTGINLAHLEYFGIPYITPFLF